MKNVQRLQSGLLREAGVTHGWFMRYGGVSKGLFDSLNGKKGNGDLDENVIENRKRALAALCHPELDSGSICDKKTCFCKDDNLAHIIHSFQTNSIKLDNAGEFQNIDASFTTKRNLVLSQTTADCGSVIIASSDGNVAGLVHGSWLTLKDNIICDVVAKIKKYTSKELVSAIGPMICTDCYEFGPEATTLFDKKYLKDLTACHPEHVEGLGQTVATGTSTPLRSAQYDNDAAEKYQVNLKQMIIDQLRQSSITQIDDLNICTKEDERFFSHRRDGAGSGRLLTLVSITDVV